MVPVVILLHFNLSYIIATNEETTSTLSFTSPTHTVTYSAIQFPHKFLSLNRDAHFYIHGIITTYKVLAARIVTFFIVLRCAAGGEQPGYMAACVGAKRTAS